MPKVYYRILVIIIAGIVTTTTAITTLLTVLNTPLTGLRERTKNAKKGLS